MPAKLKPGKKIRSYEIVRELNNGAFAIAYEATSVGKGKVFFKQYKSPTKLVDWYPGFVAHQKEIKRRIGDDPAAKDRCYEFIEFFDDPSAFFQVFEFVEGGKSLTQVLEDRSSFTEDQFGMFAKVMMFGMKALHQIKIVHTDLKPDNIILIPDSTLKNGYKLRVIDLDWAILADRQAPWHGKQGYVGTPGYLSPEHLKNEIPTPASDIFTCGIMLSQTLGEVHPFADAGDDYASAALTGRFRPIRLRQAISGIADVSFLEVILNSCLDPDAKNRPTASQVCDAFMGKTFDWHVLPPKKVIAPEPIKVTPPPLRKVVDAAAAKIELSFEGRSVVSATVDAEFGKQNFKALHADAQFLSNPQFRLRKQSDHWVIEHCIGATNETIVNGKKLASPEPVENGMRVAVGNSNKGIEKFPLMLKLVK
jgi:serine/threonine protein kinase